MNRHHPYGASFETGPARRGGSPTGGPGPDRSYRHHDRGGFRGGGRGGFRGGRGGGGGGGPAYPSYDGVNMSHGYDQDNHQPYADYEVQPPPPDAYYQPSDYGNPPPFSNGSSGYGGYDQKYEDASGPSYDNNDYNRRPRPPRKDRDDKVHDSIIEERIQRERPCRTLFIRNIKYETPSDEVRRLFEEHGEIKTFFDLIATRGMVFVTYFDLRSAERARDRLQGSEISGRPIDVHYSLPRDDRGGENQRNQQMQGTLQVTLRASPSGAPIDDSELRRRFQSFGDIKSIRPVNERIDSRYVEFYDTRAAEEAFERLKQSPLQDGLMDMVLAWDNTENQFRDGSAPGGGGHGRNWEDRGQRHDRGGGGGGGAGNRGRHNRGRGNRGGRGGYSGGDDYDRDGYGGGGGRNRGREYDDYNRGGPGPRDGPPGGYSDRYDNRGGYGGPPGPGYGAPPPAPPAGPYGMPPAPPPLPPVGPSPQDRLDQARKVQELLAALKQPSAASSAAPPIPSAQQGPPGGAPYYSQPPPSTMGYPPPPPAGPYGGAPPVGVPPPNGTATPPVPVNAALGPNLMMLLQSQQGLRVGATPPGPPGPPGGYNAPPPNGGYMMPPYMGQGPKP